MIFIPFNVPSLKNSKVSTTVGKGANKQTILAPSPAVRKYLQKLGVKKYRTSLNQKQKDRGLKMVENYSTRPNLFAKAVFGHFVGVQVPVIVKIFFIRDSKRRFDFHNAVQIVADLLVAHGCIEDDDMNHFIPVPMMINGKWYDVDKDNAGVLLKIVEV